MIFLSRIQQLRLLRNFVPTEKRLLRNATHFRSGAVKPEPEVIPLGIVRVICAVIPGLLIGAAISKNVANFLEENDLFVPSDDDDDDD